MIESVGPCVVAIEGGCGVIVSEQGHILSVSHVTGAVNRRVTVKLADGTVASGTTLGIDRNVDVGLLKLDGDREWPYLDVSGLPVPEAKTDEYVHPKLNLTAMRVIASKSPLPRGRTHAAPEIGSWCLAFGYPLSFERGQQAVVRLGQVLTTGADQIATSAVIMGGDSGGPLVDLDGRLIGIGSRVKTSVESNLNVPIQAYRDRWQQLLAGIDVVKEKRKQPTAKPSKRTWLGIFGDTDQSRVRVRQVQAGSPADAAGVKPEDVIVTFDSVEVSTFPEVVKLLKRRSLGDTVNMRVNRYGTFLDLSAQLRSKE
ncbi:S1C family serine protease [Mariniblastus sp.]|nr:S1C family serine protease [Mariniblastus sp.]